MSQSIDLVPVIDPRVDINNLRNKSYGILLSGSQQTWKQYVSTTFDNTQISWVATPPSPGVYVNRKMYVQMTFTLTFTGTSAGAGIPLLQAAGLPTAVGVSGGNAFFDAPRCCPLSEAFINAQVQLNNDNISSNLGSYSRVFQRFARPYDEENTDLSMTPSMSDKSQAYSDLSAGFALNPLASYGDNVVQCPRGGFPFAIITRNDSTGAPGDIATVNLTVTEPWWLSPFAFGRNQEEVAFIQMQNINVLCQLGGRGVGPLAGLAGSLWSHSTSGSVLSAVQAAVTGGQLFFNYITPDPVQPLPRELTYSYYEPTLYPTGSSIAINPGQTTTLVMNNVQLSAVPNRMYIWVSERDQDNDVTKTNSYFQISKVNITYNNQDGLLSNMTIQDLYQMYRRNGGNMSFPQFSTYIGSIVCVGFGSDIPLDPTWAPGLRVTQNLSMTITCTNVSARPITPTLNTLVIQEGVMFVSGNSVMRSVGVLDQKEVLAARGEPGISYKPSGNIWGSGFWDDVLTFGKRIARAGINVAKQVAPSNFQPFVSEADTLAKSYGFGLQPYGLGLGKKKGY